jgi:hypothetical protein
MTLVICSTLRVAPSQGGELYRAHAARRPRSGGLVGAAAMTTLTTRMRRDGIELQLGTIRDRRRMFALLIRPQRGVLEGGEIDHGLELALGANIFVDRIRVGLEGTAVFGIAFEDKKIAFGLALFGAYELLATDRVALAATVRVGFDSFEHALPEGATETRGDALISVGLGGTWFQVVPR